jgi:hypothetical protein
MRLEFIEGCLDLPALMIQIRQFLGWRLFRVQNRGDKSVDRFGAFYALRR